MQYGPMKILAGGANPAFARDLAHALGQELGQVSIKRFADGEVFVEVCDNIRGRDVFIVQSTCPPVNEHLMELLVLMDAVKRASADRVTVVIPYFGYARQDRKVSPRTPISAKLVADLLQVAGADRVLTVDLHAGQIQGFFDIPVDHLYATPALIVELRTMLEGKSFVIVSPDAGGVARARAYAKILEGPLAVIDKRRDRPNEIAEMRIVGDVENKLAIIVDDMADTAGTLCRAAQGLKDAGASAVAAVCAHGILSPPAVSRIEESVLERVIVSDTIPLRDDARACDKVQVVSIAPLLAEAVRRIHTGDSVSSLFESEED
ncbi:MAG: phosphoribosylpyrophosphate synthetase [Deltaproteobacteria bacterium]|nr:phosphoribosylpyrophosphate synthetase [Deltaproteobacteria bacterium]